MKRALIALSVLALLAAVFIALSTLKQFRAERDFTAVAARNPAFADELVAYQALLRAIGGVRAQTILLKTLPDNSRTHVLDHQTGKFLYDALGLVGIASCRPYFAGGCYHGFISAAVADRGLGGVQDIVHSCVNALSQDQTLQCAHGVGHAMLADIAGYAQLPQALDLCARSFEGDHKSTVNCYDGVFMENNFGEFSVPPADRWYKASDPMYPCNTAAVLGHAGAHDYCWGMQSQMTMNASAYPQFDGDVQRVDAYCHTLTGGDLDICLEGLGRQIQLNYGTDTSRIADECSKTGPDAMVCRARAAEAAYIYGDHAAIRNTCVNLPKDQATVCTTILFEGFAISYSATSTRLAACKRDIADPAQQKACAAWMNSPAGINY